MGLNIDIEDFCLLSLYRLQAKIDELFIMKDLLRNNDEYYDKKLKNINHRISIFQIQQEKLVTVNYN